MADTTDIRSRFVQDRIRKFRERGPIRGKNAPRRRPVGPRGEAVDTSIAPPITPGVPLKPPRELGAKGVTSSPTVEPTSIPNGTALTAASQAAGIPIPTTQPGAPTQAGTPTQTGGTPLEQAMQMISGVIGPESDRQTQVQQIIKAMEGLASDKQTEFDRLFGPESELRKVFLPTTRTLEQQILDTEELLTNLRTDVQERHEDVGLTQPQFRRIEAKERGELVGQMDQLTRSLARTQAGFQNALALSQAEFDNLMASKEQQIDAMRFGLEQSGLFDQAQMDLITTAFRADLNEQAAQASEQRQIAAETRADDRRTQQAIEGLLLDAQQAAFNAGINVGDTFNSLMKQVQQMAEGGATLAEINAVVLDALSGMQPAQQVFSSGMSFITSPDSGDSADEQAAPLVPIGGAIGGTLASTQGGQGFAAEQGLQPVPFGQQPPTQPTGGSSTGSSLEAIKNAAGQ